MSLVTESIIVITYFVFFFALRIQSDILSNYLSKEPTHHLSRSFQRNQSFIAKVGQYIWRFLIIFFIHTCIFKNLKWIVNDGTCDIELRSVSAQLPLRSAWENQSLGFSSSLVLKSIFRLKNKIGLLTPDRKSTVFNRNFNSDSYPFSEYFLMNKWL